MCVCLLNVVYLYYLSVYLSICLSSFISCFLIVVNTPKNNALNTLQIWQNSQVSNVWKRVLQHACHLVMDR